LRPDISYGAGILYILQTQLGQFLENHLYPKKEKMLSYVTENIPVFCVEIKFE
jgi:hypothetical protein